MCLLSYYPEGVQPDIKRLENGCQINGDGFGFAIVTRRQELIVHKTLKADEAIETFATLRALNPEGPAMFHSRWSTSGNVDVDNCHPFHVGRDQRTVVAHNGVLFDPGKDSTWSDTAIFARYILPRYSWDRPSKLHRLERYLGGNKIVILTTNPARRHNAYVIGEKLGHWIDGEWHSNRDYEGSSWRHYGNYAAFLDFEEMWEGEGTGWVLGPKSARESAYAIEAELDDKAPDGRARWAQCEFCFASYAVDPITTVCQECKSCQECGMDVRSDECMCYYPSNVSHG